MQTCPHKHLCVYKVASIGTGCNLNKDYPDYSMCMSVTIKEIIASWMLVFRISRTGEVKVILAYVDAAYHFVHFE